MLWLPPTTWNVVFTKNHVTFRAVLDPRRERPLAIYRGKQRVSEIGRKKWSPWKLEAGDVDGDGTMDFAVGVHKATRYLPSPHRSVFIYTFDGKELHKKWLGSTVGRPLVDFLLVKEGARSFLITLETVSGQESAVRRLVWSGFGFRAEGPEKILETAQRLDRYKGKIAVVRKGVILPIDLGGRP